jgi:hypothetical protein
MMRLHAGKNQALPLKQNYHNSPGYDPGMC